MEKFIGSIVGVVLFSYGALMLIVILGSDRWFPTSTAYLTTGVIAFIIGGFIILKTVYDIPEDERDPLSSILGTVVLMLGVCCCAAGIFTILSRDANPDAGFVSFLLGFVFHCFGRGAIRNFTSK